MTEREKPGEYWIFDSDFWDESLSSGKLIHKEEPLPSRHYIHVIAYSEYQRLTEMLAVCEEAMERTGKNIAFGGRANMEAGLKTLRESLAKLSEMRQGR